MKCEFEQTHFFSKVTLELKFHNFYSNENMKSWINVVRWSNEKNQIFMNSYEQRLTYVLTYKQDMFRYENENLRLNLVKKWIILWDFDKKKIRI